VSISQGASGSSAIGITRTGGFAGSVSLGVTGAPSGLTATLNPTSTTGNSSTLSLTAAGNLAAGTYPLTITGTTAGLANQTTTVNVTVTALSSSSVQYCANDTPIWFAYQNDGGAWTRVAIGANNTFTFNATSKVAFAAVTQSGTGQNASYDLSVIYTTPTEIAAIAGAICAQQTGTKQLNGSVAGIAQDDGAQISMGNSFAFAAGALPNFSLTNLPEGPLDLVAAAFPFIDQSTIAPSKLIIRRALNLQNGATIPVLDFSTGEAFAPASATLSLSGVGSDEATVLVNFLTGGGTTGLMSALTKAGASSTIYGVPTAQLGTGDTHQLFVFASPANSNDSRGVIKYVRSISGASVDVKPALNTPTITVPHATPYAQPMAVVASQSDYGSAMSASYSQASTNRDASVVVTSGYMGGTPTNWNVTLPDLSGAPQFDVNWGLKANTTTGWDVTGFGGPLSGIIGARPPDGTTLTVATRSGTLTTPASALRSPVTISANRVPGGAARTLPRPSVRGLRPKLPKLQK
jgi:hypothetical protein